MPATANLAPASASVAALVAGDPVPSSSSMGSTVGGQKLPRSRNTSVAVPYHKSKLMFAPRPTAAVKGIPNAGGTLCWLSASLQLLAHAGFESGFGDDVPGGQLLRVAVSQVLAGTLSVDKAESLRKELYNLRLAPSTNRQECAPDIIRHWSDTFRWRTPVGNGALSFAEAQATAACEYFTKVFTSCTTCGPSVQTGGSTIDVFPTVPCTVQEALVSCSGISLNATCACGAGVFLQAFPAFACSYFFVEANSASQTALVAPSTSVTLGSQPYELAGYLVYTPAANAPFGMSGHYEAIIRKGKLWVRASDNVIADVAESDLPRGSFFLYARRSAAATPGAELVTAASIRPSEAGPSIPRDEARAIRNSVRPRGGMPAASSVASAHGAVASAHGAVETRDCPEDGAPSPSPRLAARCPLPSPCPRTSVSKGRGGEGNLASDGDVEVNPGPPPLSDEDDDLLLAPQREEVLGGPDSDNAAALRPFAAAPEADVAPLLQESFVALNPRAEPKCTCRDASSRGRHAATCPKSSSFGKVTLSRSKTNGVARLEGELAAEAAADAVAAARPPAVAPAAPVPPFIEPIPIAELWSMRLPTLEYIPRRAVSAVSFALAHALSGTHHSRWWMLACFARLVLSRPAPGTRSAPAVKRRANDFATSNWAPLIEEARKLHQAAERRQAASPQSTAAPDDAPRVEFIPASPGRSLYELDEEDVIDSDTSHGQRSIRRAIALAKQGCISKAAASLHASPIAQWGPDTVESMKSLHPTAPRPIPAELVRELKGLAAPRAVSECELRRCLRGFPPRSACGPSGLSPNMLLTLVSAPGSNLCAPLANLVSEILAGAVPEAMSAFIFGAKLIALKKKDGSLRPIACSETVRRIAAKIMAARLAKQLAEALTPHAQIGVSVPCGLEALASWARQIAPLLEDDEVVCKIDFKNAFNSVFREAILRAVRQHAPELAHYVLSAYASPSHLLCGTAGSISSEVGVQQGDPLGPALFSLAALHCTSLPPALRDPLRGCGWYLDDGILIGKAADVAAALEWIREKGAEIGLVMNTTKTEILTDFPDVWNPYRADYPFVRPLDDFELLGLPCAPSAAGLQQYVSAFTSKSVATIAAVEPVIAADPHVGFLLLRMCTGFAAGGHLARAIGPLPEFTQIDSACMSALTSLVPLDERTQAIARLPFRLGGLGIRSLAAHAEVAFIAQSLSTAPLMKLFSKAALPDDPLRKSIAIPEPVVTLVADMELRVSQAKPVSNPQRALSHELDNAALAALDLSLEERARSMSCGSRGASLYLVGPLSYDDRLEQDYFMSASVFSTAIRMRLGLPVRPAESLCPMCTKKDHIVGPHGHEAINCMGSGQRTRAHNALRDALTRVMYDALLSPKREVRASASNGQRLDVCIYLSGIAHYFDAAITHPFRAVGGQRTHSLQAASSAQGGWATAYEAVKRETYGMLFDAASASRRVLVPFVVDTFGALGSSALDSLKHIITHYARRMGLSHSVASRIVRGRLSTTVVREVAMIAARV